MVKRRVIRALVAPSRTSYWLNGARQTGAEYELLKAFEEEINNQSQDARRQTHPYYCGLHSPRRATS